MRRDTWRVLRIERIERCEMWEILGTLFVFLLAVAAMSVYLTGVVKLLCVVTRGCKPQSRGCHFSAG